ncbi:MAG TPA: asparagine synthase (glutamine-hydrolyzing) [Pseudogracilibacillus sp.]|nr:asparagine synthase (glutamine-hydrolyzing) [Pseudogracilibacillus sp.]
MSGFIGYILNEKIQTDDNEIKDLNEKMNQIKHRGTKEGIYTDDYIRVGSRNLTTLTKEVNHQPLSAENGRYYIVFDGVIYNYLELKKQLQDKGYTFKTKTDTEVLLTLYIDKKEKALNDLRGMFSFVIWDKQENELFGARDTFGIKPFYFLENNHALYFASEKKSLTNLDEQNVNLEGLQYYLSYQYVPEPYTLHKNIMKLKPGNFFKKSPGKPMQIESYSELAFKPKLTSESQQIQKIQDVLRESVHLHMQSEVPLGAFLSGGVDSSAIVAFAKEVKPDIQTFTVGFEREGFSEIDIAKNTAEQLGVSNHHYYVSPEEFIKELPQVIKYMDDPVADPASVPLYFAAREASKQVKVVLSGEGADELFGGYNIYREPSALKGFNYIPKQMQKMLKYLIKNFPEGMKGKSFIERGTTPLEDRFMGNAKIFTELEKEKILVNYQSEYHYKNITKPLYAKITDYPDVHKMQYIDLHTWARGDILVKADRMSMAHGLQLRSPFIDKEVFKIASELLPEQTIAKGTTKYILRKALEGVVPNSVMYNKKLGFPVPIRHWLKNELYDWAKNIIKNSETDELIHKSYVLNLLDKHQKNQSDHSREIWVILVFMVWYEQNISLN